ncbi:zinc-ribbon domain-containing protein, partial [Bifidobacterium pseudocatenulatum]
MVYCTECGFANEQGNAFCSQCGSPLEQPEANPAALASP